MADLHRALNKLKKTVSEKTKKSRPLAKIIVKLSLGKVFQKLELQYPDIYIHIYKQKVQYHPKLYSYAYHLCGVGSPGFGHTHRLETVFSRVQAKIEYNRVEDYNWNYLDQHVCGHPEFELLQEVKMFSLSATLPAFLV